MTISKKQPARLLGLGLLLFLWLFVGVYEEREWRDIHVFLKHRPSPKVFFYTPQGEADRSYIPGKEGYLSPEQEREEQLYVEFVEKHNGYQRSIKLP
ncbi:MAG TPA: hypothetical protein VF588_16485 [Pyrinomonadaceae bacterium]|jgi:hypothetical protein